MSLSSADYKTGQTNAARRGILVVAEKFRDHEQRAAAMAEERLITTCDLSSSSSSFSISSPDSKASMNSSDDMTESGSSSRGFSPPRMPDSNGGSLFDMKSLRAGLPTRKRGLSDFFTGKSQSFMSLADVKRVEDLAKPEKKLKGSHSWTSTIKSSFNNNNQAIRSSMLSAGSAETIKKPYKASSVGKTRKKVSRLVPRNSYRLQL